MNIGKAIYGILSGTTAVSDIVGTKIFPEIAEQETAVPFVVYQVQSVQPEDTHDGPSKLDEVRVEVLCYDDAYNGAADLASAVRGALDRVRGTYNGVNVESVQFNDVDFEIEYDPRRYSQVLTFTFRIKRDDIEIALGTPITGAQLGDLSDVNVTGVTDNQILSYDAASDTWVPAADAGGAEVLDDLSDVDASQPEDNQMLAYQQGEWTTIYQDEIVLPILSVTGLQAALDAAPDNLRELTDVTISGLTDGDYLQYDSAAGEWQNSSLILGRNGEQYTGNYDTEAGTLRSGATETVELYYTAQADGDGLSESASSDTPTSGYDIRRKLYYAEKAQADPDTSADWTQFTDIADNTTFNNAKAALLAYLKERTGGTVPISLKMTWEEVAQAPAFTGLLNESYGSGAEAAYSTRRLNGNVTDCMVIRRASDSTTTTIGFDGSGNIDESAIETFCTGTTCTVVTWKDQSGNGNDATAAASTNEPTIYSGGALVKENGKVAVDFDGTDDFFESGAVTTSTQPVTVISTTTPQATAFSGGILNTTDSNNFIDFYRNDGGFAINAGTTLTSGASVDYVQDNQYLRFSLFNGASSEIFANGTSVVSGNANTTGISGNLYVGKFLTSANNYMNGLMQEVLLYASNKSTDRSDIESNIGDYFTQNTPLLDTYSGAAAAYSLRLLDSSYVGSAVEVYNGSSYADIGFNVFGELDTVALAAHCGSNDGFVSKWYDQSGNSNTATQTTTAEMPKIYDGTTGVVTENGKPAVQFDGTDDKLIPPQFLDAVSANPKKYITTVLSKGAATNVRQPYDFMYKPSGTYDNVASLTIQGSTNEIVAKDYNSADSPTSQSSSAVMTQNQNLISHSYDLTAGARAHNAYLNSTLMTGTATGYASGSANSISSAYSFIFNFDGKFQEIIAWNSDQSSNRTNIEDNINTFYNIY